MSDVQLETSAELHSKGDPAKQEILSSSCQAPNYPTFLRALVTAMSPFGVSPFIVTPLGLTTLISD